MASYIEIDITDPAGGGGSLTTYWFLHSATIDWVNDAGEFYWGVYSGLIGTGPDVSTQVLLPHRVGIDDTGQSDPTGSGFTLSVDWNNILQAGNPDPDRESIFDHAKTLTYKFNDENVDLSSGTEY